MNFYLNFTVITVIKMNFESGVTSGLEEEEKTVKIIFKLGL